MAVRQLTPETINRIAAGEVVERPASVVKELVENAIDAGAGRIDVSIARGGQESIRVVDDGGGMTADELPLAVAAHATSKIADADDLFRVATLGFRGEALASIAEVSRLTIRSRIRDAEAGAELEVVAGQMGEVAPSGGPPGTSIEVANLFLNTPVRRKFLRSIQTEVGHITETVARLALAHPAIHFTLRHNERLVYDLPGGEALPARIGRLFGHDLAAALIAVDSQEEAVRLSGYAAHPSQSRANQRMQYLILNGRYIRDRSLQHALGEAYRGLLLSGRHPIAFLRIDMPAELVDVNVHPTKLEVRFQDGGRLYSLLLGTLRTRFLSTDLTTRLDASASASASAAGAHGGASNAASGASTAADADRGETGALRQQLVDWAQQEVGRWKVESHQAGRVPPWNPKGQLGVHRAPLELHRLPESSLGGARPSSMPGAPDARSADARSADADRRAEPDTVFPADLAHPADPAHPAGAAFPTDATFPAHAAGSIAPDARQHAPGTHGSAAAEAPPGAVPRDLPAAVMRSPGASGDDGAGPPRYGPVAALQVHNRYLVAESHEGVVVIDQHALHERILYEQMREKVLAGAVETQTLLVPEPVDLGAAEAAAVLEHRELLAQLGIRVEAFGGDTVLVCGYPAILSRVHRGEMLRGVIEPLIAAGRVPERRDLIDTMLHSLACKAAVKAGDPLTPEEVAALVEQRYAVRDSHHCPHGRPTELVFTREDLDRQFKRT